MFSRETMALSRIRHWNARYALAFSSDLKSALYLCGHGAQPHLPELGVTSKGVVLYLPFHLLLMAPTREADGQAAIMPILETAHAAHAHAPPRVGNRTDPFLEVVAGQDLLSAKGGWCTHLCCVQALPSASMSLAMDLTHAHALLHARACTIWCVLHCTQAFTATPI